MSHWQRYAARWSQIAPPLRPTEDTVRFAQSIVGDPQARVLLLGVTPELADAFEHVHAVDKSSQMIATVWPGDSAAKRAVCADWLDMTEPASHFDAVVGDGSLNNILYPRELKTLYQNLARVMKPGGRFACRLFERPARAITEDDLRKTARGGSGHGFHAFKWQLAMHLAARVGANLPVALILQTFNEMFGDRDALAAATGWPRAAIDTIDVYRGSPVVYAFPDREEFRSALPDTFTQVKFVACGSYDLAPLCPILTFVKA